MSIKMFLSYSHKDEKFIEEFLNHISPLKEKVDIWYDRNLYCGSEFERIIIENLENSDIICLFISPDYLASDSCRKELEKSLEMKNKKFVKVIPIILRSCMWKETTELSRLLALPTDGKPISQFSNRDEGWVDVCSKLKEVFERILVLKNLKISKEFLKFLNSVEALTNTHPYKEKIYLDDIFVEPELYMFDESREYKGKVSFEEIINKLFDYKRLAIFGDSLSGKTTLCKVLFKKLRNSGFIPVYINDRENKFKGKIINKIKHALQFQYDNTNIDIVLEEKERIIPIIDDFHYAHDKEKIIKELIQFPICILTADELYIYNLKDEELLNSFNFFEISELKPSKRYELIKKWKSITYANNYYDIDIYNEIDKVVELIDSFLGKLYGKGVIPAYPFFIISSIIAYEIFTPVNQEITSQGHCYQALIFFYLKRKGIRNEDIDFYINFLTELAFYLYSKKVKSISIIDFNDFVKSYKKKFHLPLNIDDMINNLDQIIYRDSFNNLSFKYPYFYYYFVAKYLAEHLDNDSIKKLIFNIIENLHKEENTYICIFIIHHTRNIEILEEILLNAMCLLDDYSAATLSKDEVKFLDRQVENVIKIVLPNRKTGPEKAREEKFKVKDQEEEELRSQNYQDDHYAEDDEKIIEFKKAIKTAEVIGSILKNRAGSLEKDKLRQLFEEASFIYFRLLTFVINNMQNMDKEIVDYIIERLKREIKNKNMDLKTMDKDKLKKKVESLIWKINFLLIFALIKHAVHSLGSDRLQDIIKEVTEKINTPASFLLKHGIFMWYIKHINIDEICKRVKEKDFSLLAKRILDLMVVEYCILHPVNHKDLQKIESKLGIPKSQILSTKLKDKNS